MAALLQCRCNAHSRKRYANGSLIRNWLFVNMKRLQSCWIYLMVDTLTPTTSTTRSVFRSIYSGFFFFFVFPFIIFRRFLLSFSLSLAFFQSKKTKNLQQMRPWWCLIYVRFSTSSFDICNSQRDLLLFCIHLHSAWWRRLNGCQAFRRIARIEDEYTVQKKLGLSALYMLNRFQFK